MLSIVSASYENGAPGRPIHMVAQSSNDYLFVAKSRRVICAIGTLFSSLSSFNRNQTKRLLS